MRTYNTVTYYDETHWHCDAIGFRLVGERIKPGLPAFMCDWFLKLSHSETVIRDSGQLRLVAER